MQKKCATFIRATLLVVLLAGCSASPAPLNSDGIRARFGSYGIQVIEDNGHVRRSSLYSTHDGDRICRTYAVVRYLPVDESASRLVESPAARVRAGASMGETFRAAGWAIEKATRYVGSISIPARTPPLADLMQLSGAQTLAMHVYRFRVNKNALSIDFAEIIEIHHPGYLTIDQVTAQVDTDDLPAVAADEVGRWRSLALARE